MSDSESHQAKSLRTLDGLLEEWRDGQRGSLGLDLSSRFGREVLGGIYRGFLLLGKPVQAEEVRWRASHFDRLIDRPLIDQGLLSEFSKISAMVRAEQGDQVVGDTDGLTKTDWYLIGAIQVARSRAVFEKLSLDQWARYLQAFLERKDHAALHESMRWVEVKEMRPFFSAEDWAEIVRLAKEEPVGAADPFAEEKK